MTEPRLQDFPSLVAFGDRLMDVAAAETAAATAAASAPASASTPRAPRRHRRWAPRRPVAVALATVGTLLVASGSAAATLLVLNGSAIPPFARADDAATVRPFPGTAAVASVRAADPTPGAPPWALRVSRGPGATACVAVGQVDGGRFGLRGLDGVFRTLPARGTDSCGTPPSRDAPIFGVRDFSGERPDEQRSVVYGLGGPDLRSVTVRIPRQKPRTLPVSREGAFVAAYAGSLAMLHPTLRLRYAGGRTVTRALGSRSAYEAVVISGPSVVGWRTQTYPAGDTRCVRVVPIHAMRPRAIGPSACAPPDRFSFDSARLESGDEGRGQGAFQGYRFRTSGTFVWGQVPPGVQATLLLPRGVARMDLRLPSNGRVPVSPAPDGTFAFVVPWIPPRFDLARRVRMEAIGRDGTRRTYRTTTGLTYRGSTR